MYYWNCYSAQCAMRVNFVKAGKRRVRVAMTAHIFGPSYFQVIDDNLGIKMKLLWVYCSHKFILKAVNGGYMCKYRGDIRVGVNCVDINI